MRLLILIIVLLLASCSGKEKQQIDSKAAKSSVANHPAADSSSTHQMTFKRQQRYGSTDKVIVGEFTSFIVDDQNRVFIADQDQTTIEVFNPDGSYLTSLGRQGRGPAEFGAIRPNTTFRIHSGRLYITDFTDPTTLFPDRVQVYRLSDLSFSHTMKMIAENRNKFKELQKYLPVLLYPRNDGNFLVAYHRSPTEYRDSTSFIRYFIQDSAGTIIRGPVFEQKDRRNLVYFNKEAKLPYLAIYPFPFFEKPLFTTASNDELYAARSGEFKINVYSPNGTYIRTLQQPFHNKPFSKSEVIDRYIRTNYEPGLGEGVAVKMVEKATNLPDTWPALQSMFFDDRGRLWVSTIIDNDKVYEWWVLKKTGEVITKFNWPRNKAIRMIRNGYLYTLETSQKTGLKHVVRYLIVEKG